MADSTISNKVWNIAGILFDGGVSNSDYLEQITYLLFLKMVDEDMKMPEELRWNNWRNLELPADCDWSLLMSKSGEELKEHYGKILSLLSKKTGMIGEIYRGAQNKIQTPEHLRKVIQKVGRLISLNVTCEKVLACRMGRAGLSTTEKKSPNLTSWTAL